MFARTQKFFMEGFMEGLEFSHGSKGFTVGTVGTVGTVDPARLPGLWPLAFLGIVKYSAIMLLKYDFCKSDMLLHVIVN